MDGKVISDMRPKCIRDAMPIAPRTQNPATDAPTATFAARQTEAAYAVAIGEYREQYKTRFGRTASHTPFSITAA